MITLKGISKRYQMGDTVVTALDLINLEIAAGEFTAIVGPSGSGKSTLMNIIGCLDTASEGLYTLNQVPIHNYSDYQLADIRNQQIGFIFQQFNLLPHLTALENVEVPMVYSKLPLNQRRERAMAMLAVVGLQDRMFHKPPELSGGQQQRVSIARALANDPAIILADEPTGALDSRSGHEIMKILLGLNNHGKTVVVITHDSHVANYCSRTIALQDGVIASDTRRGVAIV